MPLWLIITALSRKICHNGMNYDLVLSYLKCSSIIHYYLIFIILPKYLTYNEQGKLE